MDNFIKFIKERANVVVEKIGNKYIIIYEDHRYLINILALAKFFGLLKDSPNIIYFDKHDDGLCVNDETKKMAIDIRRKNIDILKKIENEDFFSNFSQGVYRQNIQEIWNFTEFDLSGKDDNWLFGGMEIDVIGDAVQVGGIENNGDIKRINNGEYVDVYRQTHRIASIDNLWQSFVSKDNMITDIKKYTNQQFLIDLMDIKKIGDEFVILDSIEKKWILDFDLDCFSFDRLGRVKSWPSDRFYDLWQKNGAVNVLKKIFDRSIFITIAKESEYCGGTVESEKILEMLKSILQKE